MQISNSKKANKIESTQWMDILTDGAAQLNIAMSDDHVVQFARHARLLMAWNRKINLTAITDPVQVAIKHYLDSVAPLAHISCEGKLLDVGTGGGFPGIPLKIMRPAQSMTLVDGTRKKINFVKQVIRELGLNQVEALHTRAERMGVLEQYAGRFSVIVSRAVSDLKEVAQLANPLLADNGQIVIYKGPSEKIPKRLILEPKVLNQERARVFRATSYSYLLPLYEDQRRVVILKAE